jgi:hypothetical protein
LGCKTGQDRLVVSGRGEKEHAGVNNDGLFLLLDSYKDVTSF